QQILKQLRMRTEHSKSDRKCEHSPAPALPASHAECQHPQCEREKRAYGKFSIVTWRYERCELPAHHVSDAAKQRWIETEPARTQESEREESCKEEMDDERPRHRRVGRHQHSQKECRIENVAVHGGDVWHSSEEGRIHLGECAAAAQTCEA